MTQSTIMSKEVLSYSGDVQGLKRYILSWADAENLINGIRLVAITCNDDDYRIEDLRTMLPGD